MISFGFWSSANRRLMLPLVIFRRLNTAVGQKILTEGTFESTPSGKRTRDSGGNRVKDGGGNRTRDSGGNRTRDIGGNRTRDSGGNRTRDIGGSRTRDRGGNRMRHSGRNRTRDIGGNRMRDRGIRHVAPVRDTCVSRYFSPSPSTLRFSIHPWLDVICVLQ